MRVRDSRYGVGTVKAISDTKKSAGVEFLKREQFFHDCDGACKDGFGWWTSLKNLKICDTPFDFELVVKVFSTDLVARGYYSSERETRTEPSSFELDVQELETINGDDVMEIISDTAMKHVREALLDEL